MEVVDTTNPSERRKSGLTRSLYQSAMVSGQLMGSPPEELLEAVMVVLEQLKFHFKDLEEILDDEQISSIQTKVLEKFETDRQISYSSGEVQKMRDQLREQREMIQKATEEQKPSGN